MDISFEYFPPKTEKGLANLLKTTERLQQLSPEFYSVTFGAGGSSQSATVSTVTTLKETFKADIAPHISCVHMTKATAATILERYQKIGIKHLVVLRGDQPSGMINSQQDFNYAYQLVQFIREQTGPHFFIEVAAYPEMHPETLNPSLHIEHLKMKFDAGANRAITQYFFNSDAYFQLCDDAKAAGINASIIPGIMPITNYTQLARFSHICGAEIPRWLDLRLKAIYDDPNKISALGEHIVTRLCRKLIDGGAPGLHFYTLNKANPTIAILTKLKLITPQKSAYFQ